MARHIWADGDALTSTRLNAFPGGIVGYAVKSANQSGIGSSVTDISSLSVTFTAESGRLYRTTLWLPYLIQNTSTGRITAYIANSGGTTQAVSVVTTQPTYRAQMMVVVLDTSASGSTTRKARIETSAGTVDVLAGTAAAYITVEDLGVA